MRESKTEPNDRTAAERIARAARPCVKFTFDLGKLTGNMEAGRERNAITLKPSKTLHSNRSVYITDKLF